MAVIFSSELLVGWIGALCSTALLVINGYLKDADFASEQKEHLQTANQLWPIRERYLSLLTDFSILPDDEILNLRDALSKQTGEIYSSAPQTDKRSYNETQLALKTQEEQFFNQDELNAILPAHLRKQNTPPSG